MNLRAEIVRMEQREAELEPKAKELWERCKRAEDVYNARSTEWLAVYRPLEETRKALEILRRMEGEEL